MANQRIKGQEVSIMLTVDGSELKTITEVQNFEVVRELESTEEGYLGETANRYDEFYKGYSGKLDVHTADPAVFDLMQAVQDRAQRRTPGTVINIRATLNYPSGEKRTVMMLDAFFDSIPLNFGSRGDYGSVSLNFKGADVRAL
jgi:hypothetical protein